MVEPVFCGIRVRIILRGAVLSLQHDCRPDFWGVVALVGGPARAESGRCACLAYCSRVTRAVRFLVSFTIAYCASNLWTANVTVFGAVNTTLIGGSRRHFAGNSEAGILRKAASVMLSFLFFPKHGTWGHAVGGAIFFFGLMASWAAQVGLGRWPCLTRAG